jgi:hypothetical protein
VLGINAAPQVVENVRRAIPRNVQRQRVHRSNCNRDAVFLRAGRVGR